MAEKLLKEERSDEDGGDEADHSDDQSDNEASQEEKEVGVLDNYFNK